MIDLQGWGVTAFYLAIMIAFVCGMWLERSLMADAADDVNRLDVLEGVNVVVLDARQELYFEHLPFRGNTLREKIDGLSMKGELQ